MIEHRSKKFVFNIYQENIPIIESMSYEQKNALINKALQEHLQLSSQNKKERELINFLTKTILMVLLVIGGIPLFIMTINFCFDTTVNSYTKMERNFERLFNEQQR